MYRFKEITDQKNWDQITISGNPYAQSFLYGTLQEQRGCSVDRYAIYQQNTLVGYFQAITYPLIKKYTSIYLPHGPVLLDNSKELLDELAAFLKTYGYRNNAVYVRVDADKDHERTYPEPYKSIPSHAYKTAYHQPRGEMTLDLSRTQEELLAGMHKKTRYNVNKALKQDMQTTFITGAGIKGWDTSFIEINHSNIASHQTTTHPDSYFKVLFEYLAEQQGHFLAVTKNDTELLAINVFVRDRDHVFCPFGASSESGKKLGAYYHIKYNSLLYMKSLGVTTFNWGGIAIGMHDEGLAGVTKFKTGFGGDIINHGMLHDIVIEPWIYKLYMLYKRIRT